MADPERIVVLAPNWLGDAVMALPAIADMRRRFPRAWLAVAARAPVADLFALVPGVDAVVALGWTGRLAALRAFARDAATLRRAGPDVVLLLPNSFASALLARASGAAGRWGYATDGRSRLLTRAIARPATSMHQTAYYRHLTASLGIEPYVRAPEVTVPPDAIREAERLLRAAGWDGVRPVAVLAPGAAYGTAKRWLPSHFASLAAQLIAQVNAHVVIVGSGADRATAREILAAVPADVRSEVADLCGRTTLVVLAGVLARAQVCVSNDSGAMHLAAAVGVPLAAIFGPTNEHETAPVPRDGVPARVLIQPVACRPCMLRECPIDHPCMRDLEPARVYAAVRDLLPAGTS